MDYIITKQTPRNEWRIYLDKEIKDEFVVYKGHKLGLEPDKMIEFLEYRRERSSNKIYFLDYQKSKESPDPRNTSMWIVGTIENIERVVLESWDTLQNKLKEKDKNFRKITVTRVNI